MKVPFKKSCVFSHTTRKNRRERDKQGYEDRQKAQNQRPAFKEVPLTMEEEAHIRDDYPIFQHAAREDAKRKAAEQGIHEPEAPNWKNCKPDHYAAFATAGAGFAAGVAVSAR